MGSNFVKVSWRSPPFGSCPKVKLKLFGLGGALQAVLIEDFHAADIPILLGPDGQAGVEVLRPVGRVFQHGLDAVIHSDLLGVCGRLHQGGPASGEGCTGDGELAAGGPDRHLGEIPPPSLIPSMAKPSFERRAYVYKYVLIFMCFMNIYRQQ